MLDNSYFLCYYIPMPRSARIVIPGIPHHITQRGNDRQVIFFDDADRFVYIDLLKEQAREHRLIVLGYCLMSNHTHHVGVPEREDSLANAVGMAHYKYTLYFNQRYQHSGHLWQERFYSCPLDDVHTNAALCYIDRNAVRAKLCERAWEYPWSSAWAHVNGTDPSGLLDMDKWKEYTSLSDWQARLSLPEDNALINCIRTATQFGHPLGSKEFIRQIAMQTGRSFPIPR